MGTCPWNALLGDEMSIKLNKKWLEIIAFLAGVATIISFLLSFFHENEPKDSNFGILSHGQNSNAVGVFSLGQQGGITANTIFITPTDYEQPNSGVSSPEWIFVYKYVQLEPARPNMFVMDANGRLHSLDGYIIAEIVNNSVRPNRIYSYSVEVMVRKKWFPVALISITGGESFYVSCNATFEKCFSLTLEDGAFEDNARDKVLREKESIKGSIFIAHPFNESLSLKDVEDIRVIIQDLNGKQSIFVKSVQESKGGLLNTLGLSKLHVGEAINLKEILEAKGFSLPK